MVFSQLDTTILVDLPLSAAQLLPQWDEIFLKEHFDLGGIQQLRGQEEGEGGSAKSPCLSTQGGGPLNVHVDQNLAISESISYFRAL